MYDEARGEWLPRWGFGSANGNKGKKGGQADWLVEVDEKKEREAAAAAAAAAGAKPGKGKGKDKGKDKGKLLAAGESRAERLARMKRAERKMRADERAKRKSSNH